MKQIKTTYQNRVQKKLAIDMRNWKFLLKELEARPDKSMSDIINRILDESREEFENEKF